MKINPTIFKAYDIRGIYPQDLNEENIEKIVQAIYLYLSKTLNKENLTLVLGRDMRQSSPTLFEKAKQTLYQMGATIIDIDLATTPTNYFVAHHFQFDGGIQITASHNPPQWNGLKFFFCRDQQIFKASKILGMEEVKQMVLTNSLTVSKKAGKIEEKKEAVKDEVKFTYSLVQPKHKKFKIVVDPANAMGILLFDEIFKIYEAEVIKLNYYLDGTFPAHEANPLKFETLKQLQETVIAQKADLGIATDGDADRIFFVDDQGKIISSTLISALIADEILKKEKGGGILCDVRYVYNVKNIVEKNQGKFYLAPVGHALITKKLNEVKAVFCGESSGHYYFKEYGGAESAVRVIFTVFDVLAKSSETLSTLIKKYQSAFESGEMNFTIPTHLTLEQIFEKISQQYPQSKIDRLDGLTIELNDFRFNLRGSNTEPLIRLNCEAFDEKILKEEFEQLKQFLLDLGLKTV